MFFAIELFILVAMAGTAALVYVIVRRGWGKALLVAVGVIALLVIGLVGLTIVSSPRVRIVERNIYPDAIHEHVYRQQRASRGYVEQQPNAVREQMEEHRRNVERIQREARETHERAMARVQECQQEVESKFVERVNESGKLAELHGSNKAVDLEWDRVRIESDEGRVDMSPLHMSIQGHDSVVEMGPGRMRIESEEGVVDMSPGEISMREPESHQAAPLGDADEGFRVAGPGGSSRVSRSVYYRSGTSWAYQSFLLAAMLALITMVYAFLQVATKRYRRA